MNESNDEKTLYLSFDNTIKSTYQTFDDENAAQIETLDETLEISCSNDNITELAVQTLARNPLIRLGFNSSTPQKAKKHNQDWKMESFAADNNAVNVADEDKENSMLKVVSNNNSTLTTSVTSTSTIVEKSLNLIVEEKQPELKTDESQKLTKGGLIFHCHSYNFVALNK